MKKSFVILFLLTCVVFTGCNNKQSQNKEIDDIMKYTMDEDSSENSETPIENNIENGNDIIEYTFKDSIDTTTCRLLPDNTIEYTWDDEIFTQKLDKDTFIRIKNALEYIWSDKDAFDEKAHKYNRINTTGGADFYGMQMCFNYAYGEIEKGEIILKDIEYIRDYKEPDIDYTLYTSIRSSMRQEDGYISSYLNDDDETIKIVDYDTYVKMWDYYTLNKERPYSDKNKDYLTFVRLGFHSFITTRIDNISVNDNKIDIDMFSDANGVMADGDGMIFIVPVDKGTKLGNINIYSPSSKDDIYY